MKLNLLIFLIKFRHRYGIPCRGWNVNILSLDQSNSQDRQQTDGSISPTVRIEVGNFSSMDPIASDVPKIHFLPKHGRIVADRKKPHPELNVGVE